MAGWGLRPWRLMPLVGLVLALAAVSCVILVILPHDQAVEMVQRVHRSFSMERVRRFMHGVHAQDKAKIYLNSLRQVANHESKLGHGVIGNSQKGQQRVQYYTQLKGRLGALQAMLEDQGGKDYDAEHEDHTFSHDPLEEFKDMKPPFNESLELPPPACDLDEFHNCLGSLLAAEQQELTPEERQQLLRGSDHEVAHNFCENIKSPFQCACKACNPELLSTWNNRFWTQDQATKMVILRMRKEVHCKELEEIGEANFPPGHGCTNLYETICEHKLDSTYCPAVLSPSLQTNRYGIAQTLLDERTFWMNPHGTCSGEKGHDLELQCKKNFDDVFHPHQDYCGPMHDYLKCMCDSCEPDVERTLTGFANYSRCPTLQKALGSSKEEDCQLWLTDECHAPPGPDYCEHVIGSLAWKRTQPPPPPPPDYDWSEDGMSWKTYCNEVVKSMAEDDQALEDTVGVGWRDWCRAKMGEEPAPDTELPAGGGWKHHDRLPISGMPAPRFDDHIHSV